MSVMKKYIAQDYQLSSFINAFVLDTYDVQYFPFTATEMVVPRSREQQVYAPMGHESPPIIHRSQQNILTRPVIL